ncbi:MAG TPA: response regulator [bacterium]|nr:response regulator [bacterium]
MAEELFNVMLVDDEQMLLDELSEYLSTFSYLNVKTFNNPVIALNSVKQFRPHIIISDLMMPEVNGIELLKEVKKINKEIEFIIMTGFGDMDSTIQALQNRASNFLLKPVRFELLIEYLNRCIDHIKIEKEKKLNQMILRHSDRMVWMGMIGSKIVHDSRNVLTYIKGNVQNLNMYFEYIKQAIEFYLEKGEDKIKPKLKYILNDIPNVLKSMQEGADNFSNIVNSFFTVGDTNENIPIEKFEIREIIYKTLDLMNYFNTNSILINYQKNESEDVFILGDRHQIEIAILNILLNAHYACQNIPDGTIGLQSYLENNKYIMEIMHNGEPIPTEDLSSIFDPLYGSKMQDKQFWIGLSISKRIVQKHNGRLTANTDIIEDRKLTKFTMEFPIAK